MDSLLEKLSASLEEGTGDDDDGSGTITSLNILSLGDLDEHFCGWMDDLHLFQNSGAIIGNQNSSLWVLDLFQTTG